MSVSGGGGELVDDLDGGTGGVLGGERLLKGCKIRKLVWISHKGCITVYANPIYSIAILDCPANKMRT